MKKERATRSFLISPQEPEALKNGFDILGDEAYAYLKRSGALVKTPINRLEVMNKKGNRHF